MLTTRRVMFLGAPGVGKTQLIASLLGQEFSPEKSPTQSVQVTPVTVTDNQFIPTAGGDLEFWDFGGHWSYDIGHSHFLSPHDLYVIVTRGYYDDSCDRARVMDQGLDLLQNIHSCGGRRVLIVCNKVGRNEELTPYPWEELFGIFAADPDCSDHQVVKSMTWSVMNFSNVNRDHLVQLRETLARLTVDLKPAIMSPTIEQNRPLLIQLFRLLGYRLPNDDLVYDAYYVQEATSEKKKKLRSYRCTDDLPGGLSYAVDYIQNHSQVAESEKENLHFGFFSHSAIHHLLTEHSSFLLTSTESIPTPNDASGPTLNLDRVINLLENLNLLTQNVLHRENDAYWFFPSTLLRDRPEDLKMGGSIRSNYAFRIQTPSLNSYLDILSAVMKSLPFVVQISEFSANRVVYQASTMWLEIYPTSDGATVLINNSSLPRSLVRSLHRRPGVISEELDKIVAEVEATYNPKTLPSWLTCDCKGRDGNDS